MNARDQAAEPAQDEKLKPQAEAAGQPAFDESAPPELPAIGSQAAAGNGSIGGQAALITRPWHSAQRHAITAQIGRTQGNRHLQRVIDTARLRQKTRPESQQPKTLSEGVSGNVIRRDSLDAPDPSSPVEPDDGMTIDPDSPVELDEGTTPDPLDPFEEPTNWDSLATPMPGPDKPDQWAGKTMAATPLSPLPKLKADGEPASRVTPDQQNAANLAINAFESDYATANSSWNAVAPLIESYTDASKDVEGIAGSAEEGWNWDLGDKEADLSKLTEQQQIGPDNGTTTIDALFKDNDGSPGTTTNIDTQGLKSSEETKSLLHDAKDKGSTVSRVCREHAGALHAVEGTATGIKAALLLIEINEAKVNKDRIESAKETMIQERDTAVEALEASIGALESFTLIAFGAAEGEVRL